MLCGASDTKQVAVDFGRVVRDFGGDPWHYQAGHIRYLNGLASSWLENSTQSIHHADVCVFVILEQFGAITWGTEFGQAVADGRPFLILCLSSTYAGYLGSSRQAQEGDLIPDDTRLQLWRILAQLEGERQLTIVSFEYAMFGEVLRRELARLFTHSLDVLSDRLRRQSLSRLLNDPDGLSQSDLATAEETALDEFEDKHWRKLAVLALARRGAASDEAVRSLLASREQGVQRLTLSHLPELHTLRPPDQDFLAECVAIANDSDDVGLARRLIIALFGMDATTALTALASLDLSEVGSRRRLADAISAAEHELARDPATRELAVEMLARCTRGDETPSWKERAKACRARLLELASDV